MSDTERAVVLIAQSIANKATAIAEGTLVGPRYAAILNIQSNLDTLAAYVGDDR